MRKVLVCVVMICMLCVVMTLPTYAGIRDDVVQEEFGGGDDNSNFDEKMEEFERLHPNINPNISTSEVLGGLIDDICRVARYIGIIQFVVGLVMYIMAYKDDHPESIARATGMMVIGAILLGLKTLLKTSGLIN